MQDMREDMTLLKYMYKKHQAKLDQMVAEELSPRRRSRSPQKTELSGDQFKRILDLIDNNSQAMNLQRESFNNIMVRVQLLEKALARRDLTLDPLSKSQPKKPDLVVARSRRMSAQVNI